MNRRLEHFKLAYQGILESKSTKHRKTLLLANLMTQMEAAYRIPMMNNEKFNRENPDLMKLYREVSAARTF